MGDDYDSRQPCAIRLPCYVPEHHGLPKSSRRDGEGGRIAYYGEHGEMPKPYLKTVIFDGADHWLHICETIMKVDDLKLGPDGIAVAGKDATTKIGRFNWNIRKSRYNSALTALQELCRLGVHCYIITHGKTAYDSGGNEIIGAETPHWLKDTEGWPTTGRQV